jgi:hypothetical protein
MRDAIARPPPHHTDGASPTSLVIDKDAPDSRTRGVEFKVHSNKEPICCGLRDPDGMRIS